MIRIWSTQTLATIAILTDSLFQNTILDMEFTSKVKICFFIGHVLTESLQNSLFVVSHDDKLNISLWNWKDQQLISSTSVNLTSKVGHNFYLKFLRNVSMNTKKFLVEPYIQWIMIFWSLMAKCIWWFGIWSEIKVWIAERHFKRFVLRYRYLQFDNRFIFDSTRRSTKPFIVRTFWETTVSSLETPMDSWLFGLRLRLTGF